MKEENQIIKLFYNRKVSTQLLLVQFKKVVYLNNKSVIVFKTQSVYNVWNEYHHNYISVNLHWAEHLLYMKWWLFLLATLFYMINFLSNWYQQSYSCFGNTYWLLIGELMKRQQRVWHKIYIHKKYLRTYTLIY